MGAAPGWRRCASENYRTFQETTDGPVLASGVWHHVAAVWNARARHARVYLDGKLHRELLLRDADRLEPICGQHLGGNRAGDGIADWDGWIDEVAIFDVELTARQIAALARGGDVSAGNVLARIPKPATPRTTGGRRELPGPAVPANEATTPGPLPGHGTERDAVVWARVPRPDDYTATARAERGHSVAVRATAADFRAGDGGLRSDGVHFVADARPRFPARGDAGPELARDGGGGVGGLRLTATARGRSRCSRGNW